MQFFYKDLGRRKRGEVIKVKMTGDAANIRLMDTSNFSSFKRLGTCNRAYGGHAKKSPVHLKIPHSGRWYVTLDHGGYRGRTCWGVEVLPGALPPIRNSPLSSMPGLVRQVGEESGPVPDRETGQVYDVFISHASEDKESFVRPLAHALQAEGLSVWYDEFEMRIGANLRQKIDRGLASSRTGVVVLSKHFFTKGWPNYELDGLMTRDIDGEQVLLPIWHNVSKDEVKSYSPSLVNRIALRTTDKSVEEIAAEIEEEIRSRDHC